MKALDLFTGYGGITLALQGYVEPIAYVEIEEYAQKIIAYRMADGSLPRAPILADVKNIKGSLGICDIIYGGFPCQDISVAGLGKGLDGERSGLFYEVIRLTKEIRPSFVFLENVPAIRTRGLEQVIKAFTEIRYECRWTCLSASSVGAPHKRERWFLLAHTDSKGLERFWCEIRGEKKITKPCKPVEARAVANAYGESKELRQAKEWKQDTKSLWTMASDDWDYNASEFLRMGYGDSFRLDRIKAIGNGVVPLQARKAFELLIGIKGAI